jgi:putative tryptophan/tyrosine transport system substrate-binding protein
MKLKHLCVLRKGGSSAAAGCLAGLGPDLGVLLRRMARFVARVLRGEAPGAIPIERADRYELVVNLRTARALGVELPPLLLARPCGSRPAAPPAAHEHRPEA